MIRTAVFSVLVLTSAALAGTSSVEKAEAAEKYWAAEHAALNQPLEEKAESISQETAGKLFAENGNLKKNWEEAFPGGVKDPLKGAAGPGYELRNVASVVRFSEKHLVIRVTRYSVMQMNKSDRRDLGDLIVERSEELDKKFNVASLAKRFQREFRGVRQGMKWDVAEKESGMKWTARENQADGYVTYTSDGNEPATVHVWNGYVLEVEQLILLRRCG